RDKLVTGVQTCALPICVVCYTTRTSRADGRIRTGMDRLTRAVPFYVEPRRQTSRVIERDRTATSWFTARRAETTTPRTPFVQRKIGRASCRERGEHWGA